MLCIALAVLSASLSLSVTRSPAVAPLDSVGVPRSLVPREALKAIDAFIGARECLPQKGEPERYRQREIGGRLYFIGDFDRDGTRDVATLYDMQISQGDTYWLLFAMGPRYRRIPAAQIGTLERNGCRYVKFRGFRYGHFEFDTMYYEPGAPACCPSVPGRSKFGYSAGDIVEFETTIEWAKRRLPGY